MSLFKIQISKENIRKIKIDPEFFILQNFTEFLELNYAKYLTQGEYLIQYIDEDGDLVSVTNQIEWDTMFYSVKNDVNTIQLSIKVLEESNSDDEQVKVFPFAGFLPEVIRMIQPEIMKMCSGQNESFGEQVFPFAELAEFVPEIINMLQPEIIKMSCGQNESFDDFFSEMKFIGLSQKALQMMDIGDEEHLNYAKNLLQKALSMKPTDPITLYNLACIESLLSNVDEAIFQLMNAINNGYDNLSHMLQDPDFDNIRETQGFSECVSILNPEEKNKVSEPEIQNEVLSESKPEEEKVSEPEINDEVSDLIDDYASILSSMGFTFDKDFLKELVGSGNSIDQVITNLLSQ